MCILDIDYCGVATLFMPEVKNGGWGVCLCVFDIIHCLCSNLAISTTSIQIPESNFLKLLTEDAKASG